MLNLIESMEPFGLARYKGGYKNDIDEYGLLPSKSNRALVILLSSSGISHA